MNYLSSIWFFCLEALYTIQTNIRKFKCQATWFQRHFVVAKKVLQHKVLNSNIQWFSISKKREFLEEILYFFNYILLCYFYNFYRLSICRKFFNWKHRTEHLYLVRIKQNLKYLNNRMEINKLRILKLEKIFFPFFLVVSNRGGTAH